jgi:hypothetical protein
LNTIKDFKNEDKTVLFNREADKVFLSQSFALNGGLTPDLDQTNLGEVDLAF